LVIIFILINNHLLVSKGIWAKREHEIENIYQAMERIASTKHLKLRTIEETKAFNFKWLFGSLVTRKKNAGLFSKQYLTSSGKFENKNKKPDINIKKDPMFFKKLAQLKYKKELSSNLKEEKKNEPMKPENLENYNEKDRTYYQRLFPKIRNEKPGNEYYASYTIAMLLIIIYILAFISYLKMKSGMFMILIKMNI